MVLFTKLLILLSLYIDCLFRSCDDIYNWRVLCGWGTCIHFHWVFDKCSNFMWFLCQNQVIWFQKIHWRWFLEHFWLYSSNWLHRCVRNNVTLIKWKCTNFWRNKWRSSIDILEPLLVLQNDNDRKKAKVGLVKCQDTDRFQ
jgi:hypothetical protein